MENSNKTNFRILAINILSHAESLDFGRSLSTEGRAQMGEALNKMDKRVLTDIAAYMKECGAYYGPHSLTKADLISRMLDQWHLWYKCRSFINELHETKKEHDNNTAVYRTNHVDDNVMEEAGEIKDENMELQLGSHPVSHEAPATDPMTMAISQIAGQAMETRLNELKADVKRISLETYQELDLPKKVEIKVNELPASEASHQHRDMPELLRLMTAGFNVMLSGDKGGGKTKAAEQAAEALGKPMFKISLGPQTPQSELFGYYDANGEYVETEFRRAYEGKGDYADGAVILLDEVDACNERVAITMNAALDDSGVCNFRDGMVSKQKSLYIIAAGNTLGVGNDTQYTARRQQDAAFLSRFICIKWDIDEGLEKAILREILGDERDVLSKIKDLRKHAKELNMAYDVGMRKSIQFAKAIAAGIPEPEAIKNILLGFWSEQDIERGKESISWL